jgi:hypothetical protein
MLIDIFLFAIVGYILYKLVFDFIVPVSKATRQFRRQFRNMRDSGQGNPFQRQYAREDSSKQPPRPKQHPKEDYIDFEEIK